MNRQTNTNRHRTTRQDVERIARWYHAELHRTAFAASVRVGGDVFFWAAA